MSKVVSALGLLALVSVAAPPLATARVAYVTGTEHEEIIISGVPGATAAVNPGAYVVPVDLAAQTAGSEIPLGGQLAPLGVAIAPDGKKAYVASTYNEEVIPIDVATNKAGAAIPVGEFPESVAITPDGSRAYVPNFGGDTVTRIDLPAGTTKTISVGDGPSGIAITPDGSRAYVTNYFEDTVSPIDLATDTAGTAIPVGEFPWGIAITPDGSRAYVVNAGDETVTRIDIPADSVGATIAVGEFPQLIAINPSGDRAFVIGGYRPITPIDLATDTAEANVVTGDSLGGVALLPDGTKAYFTDRVSEGLLGMLEPANTLAPSFPVGERPEAIAIVPNQPPNAAFGTTPAKPEPGAEVSFDATGSTDSDGTVARYDWDFGDGDTAEDAGPSPKHTYAKAGTYQVTLTTTDNEGCSIDFVFTGQTAYCSGSDVAQKTHSVTVAAPVIEKEPEAKVEEQHPQSPPQAVANVNPCAPVAGNASTFVPKLRSSHVVPGVRVRLAAEAPAHLAIEPKLLWSEGGKVNQLDLDAISVDIVHWRRIRIPIPSFLRENLPLGSSVGLKMQIQSSPADGSGCTSTVTQKKLRVRVVKVIPDAVQAQ